MFGEVCEAWPEVEGFTKELVLPMRDLNLVVAPKSQPANDRTDAVIRLGLEAFVFGEGLEARGKKMHMPRPQDTPRDALRISLSPALRETLNY